VEYLPTLKMNTVILLCQFTLNLLFDNRFISFSLRRHAASSYEQLEIIELLVKEAGAIVDIRDSDGDTPLLFAEKPSVYELLISLGADPNARNNENEGIVEKAFEDENEELLEYLISQGVISNPEDIEKLRRGFQGNGMEEDDGEDDGEQEGDEEDDREDSNS
jgi:hypothetical protein